MPLSDTLKTTLALTPEDLLNDLEEQRHEIALRLLRDQRPGNPEEIMWEASEAVGTHLGIARAGFFEMLDADTMQFTVEWHSGELPSLEGVRSVDFIGLDVLRVARAGGTVTFSDSRVDEVARGSSFPEMGTLSGIGAPIFRNGKWIAGFYINHTEERAWTPSDARFVRVIAEQTWAAVQLARDQVVVGRTAKQLALAVDAGELATWKYDPGLEIISGDVRAGEFFGLPEPVGPIDLWIGKLHPDDQDRVRGEFIAATKGEPYETEFRVGQGEDVRWICAKARRTEQGSVSPLVGLCEDITKRKRAEQNLETAATRLSLAQQSGQMASWQLNTATQELVWDSGSEWTYGRSPAEMVQAEDIFSYIHPEDREKVRRDLIPALEGTGDYRSEFRVLWPDSSEHWIQAFGRTMRDSGGKAIGIVGLNINITEQKEAEIDRLNRQHFLLTLSDRQRRSSDSREVLELTAAMLGKYLDTGRVGYAESLGDGHRFAFNTGWVQGGMQLLTGSTLLDDFGEKVFTAFREKRNLVITDVESEMTAEEAKPYQDMGIQSSIVVPFVRSDELRGLLYVNEDKPRKWSEAEIELVQEVAERTAESVERAQIEAELRLGAERLRLATRAAQGMGVFDWHVKIDLLYGDETFARIWRMPFEEAQQGAPLGRIVDLMHPDDQPRVQTAIEAAMRDGGDYVIDYRVGAGSHYRWVAARGCCFKDEKGNPGRFPGVVLDITERKQMEDDLRVSEANMRLAVDTARLGTWSLDIATMTLQTSALCKENFGRESTDEFTYADLVASIHPEDRDGMSRAVQDAIDNDTEYRSEYRVIWPDGSLNWVIATGRLLPRAEITEQLTMVGVSLNVTERRLAETALIQSEKLAAVGRLASSIAHEINNPLESVTNLLYLAANAEDREELQHYLATADSELRRASSITNHTLRFHKQASNPVAVDIVELITGVLNIHDSRIKNSHVTVQRRHRAHGPVVCFDGEIRQVLGNLIGNAADAMAGSGGTLFIRSRQAHDWRSGREGIVVTVADTGIGMTPKTLVKLFEAFYSTKGIGGTGLGLWISKEIVDRHHGRLSVRSSQRPSSHGTVFTLFLPFDAVIRR